MRRWPALGVRSPTLRPERKDRFQKSPKCRPFLDEWGGDTGVMDKKVVFQAAHRTLTQPLPRKGVRLLMIGPRASVSMALAPQRRMARAKRRETRA